MNCLRYVSSFLLPILALSFLFSCSSKKTKRENTNHEIPEWVYEVEKSCESTNICASGEGTSFNISDINAKQNLASIFQTHVKGSIQISKSSFSKKEINEIEENIEKSVMTFVDEILKGVKIETRAKSKNIFFSKAVLSKEQTRDLLMTEVKRIDSEMSHFFAQKKKVFLFKLNELYNRRTLLNEKLILVNSAAIPEKISFAQINDLKFTQRDNSNIKVIYSSNFPRVLEMKINEILNQVGFKITRKKNFNSKILIDFNSKEEYLNVKGFKKYSYQINLTSFSKSSKEIGSIVVSLVSSGRNEKDAFLKIRKDIVQNIKNNLEKLNL